MDALGCENSAGAQRYRLHPDNMGQGTDLTNTALVHHNLPMLACQRPITY
jgi:hypothetical protein